MRLIHFHVKSQNTTSLKLWFHRPTSNLIYDAKHERCINSNSDKLHACICALQTSLSTTTKPCKLYYSNKQTWLTNKNIALKIVEEKLFIIPNNLRQKCFYHCFELSATQWWKKLQYSKFTLKKWLEIGKVIKDQYWCIKHEMFSTS